MGQRATGVAAVAAVFVVAVSSARFFQGMASWYLPLGCRVLRPVRRSAGHGRRWRSLL